jgi:hypothetical protein
MRLQLLAAAIDRAGREGRPEMDAKFACVLHVAPRANSEFRERITSDGLKPAGSDIHAMWAKVAPEGRFFGVDSEGLLAAAVAHMPDRASAAYVESRYLPIR